MENNFAQAAVCLQSSMLIPFNAKAVFHLSLSYFIN